jgi:hypothetical protein
MFEENVKGAVNSWIRSINSESMDFGGVQLIENKWHYYITNKNDFVTLLTVNGTEREINFSRSEWYNFGANMLGNPKLKALHNELIK